VAPQEGLVAVPEAFPTAAPFVPPSPAGDDALRLTSERLRALIDHLQSGLLVEDEHRNIVHVNHEFLKMFGVPLQPDQMIGMNCSQAAEQAKGLFDGPDAFVGRIAELLARRDLAKGDELTLVDGRYLERDYVPILLDGQFRGHYWHYRDVTERTRAQREIRQLNRELERRVEQLADANLELARLDRARAQLVSAVAHELGNALSPIRCHLAVLNRTDQPAPGSRAEAARGGMDRSVDRLSLLVEDLLDASRLQSGRFSVHTSTMDLSRVLNEAAESFEDRARERSVTLELSVPPELRVVADARRVLQVMFNLLGNALKFTPSGGRIHVRARREGDVAVVEVEDTGAGIPPEAIPKLFAPFAQAHDPATGPKGTGLGLFICRGIVEQHGGRIWVRSEGPGQGATFAFTLPPEGARLPPAAAGQPVQA
jgi:two-component system, OmpR family, sensor histidine kinase VicK